MFIWRKPDKFLIIWEFIFDSSILFYTKSFYSNKTKEILLKPVLYNYARTYNLLLLPLFLILILFINSCSDSSTGPVDNLRVRKNVLHLTPQEKKDFVNALLQLKQVPSPYNGSFNYYDQFVYWHRNAFYCDSMAAHMGPAFLPWHRQYLLLLEKALTDVSGKQINIPYWDWTDPASTNAVFQDDMMGGTGDLTDGYALKTGPFKKGDWVLNVFDQPASFPYQIPHIVRAIGTFPNAQSLPTSKEVEDAMKIETYDMVPYDITVPEMNSFRNYLEGWRGRVGEVCQDSLMMPIHSIEGRSEMHNKVHLWAGGMTGDTVGTFTLNTSPNDPLFWLHHANVDRLWAKWSSIHGLKYAPESGGMHGHNLNDHMWPYNQIGLHVTPKSMLNHKALGYRYEEE